MSIQHCYGNLKSSTDLQRDFLSKYKIPSKEQQSDNKLLHKLTLFFFSVSCYEPDVAHMRRVGAILENLKQLHTLH